MRYPSHISLNLTNASTTQVPQYGVARFLINSTNNKNVGFFGNESLHLLPSASTVNSLNIQAGRMRVVKLYNPGKSSNIVGTRQNLTDKIQYTSAPNTFKGLSCKVKPIQFQLKRARAKANFNSNSSRTFNKTQRLFNNNHKKYIQNSLNINPLSNKATVTVYSLDKVSNARGSEHRLNYAKHLQMFAKLIGKENSDCASRSSTTRALSVFFVRKEKSYTKLKYSRVPQYDTSSNASAALLAGLLGFIISEKFGFEMIDSGDLYVFGMYVLLLFFTVRVFIKSSSLAANTRPSYSPFWICVYLQILMRGSIANCKKLFRK